MYVCVYAGGCLSFELVWRFLEGDSINKGYEK